MVRCLERLKGTKNLANKRTIRLLFQLMEYAVKTQKMTDVIILNILTHVCRYVDSELILTSMKYFLYAHDEVVSQSINELFSGTNLLYKTSFFELLTATIISSKKISQEKNG